MGLFGIEKIEKDKGTFIDSSQVNHHKPNKKVDNLAEMDKIVLEKKAQEDLKRQQEEEAKKVQELVEQQRLADLEAQAKVEADYLASLDPLDNANNPVPVNPVAPKEEKVVKESLGFGGLLKIIFGMILHPGDILEEKPDKYGTLVNGLKLSLVLTILTVVFSLAARVLTGMFVKDYNSITGAYNTRFDINNIFLQDYAYYLITAVVISGVSILIISLIYYISSFFNNKGVSFGEYLVITNASFVPLLLGFSILLPVGCVFHNYLGYALLGVSVIYTLVCFISGINQALSFSSVNRKIIYNAFNLSVIFIAIAAVVYYIYFSGAFVIATGIRV